MKPQSDLRIYSDTQIGYIFVKFDVFLRFDFDACSRWAFITLNCQHREASHKTASFWANWQNPYFEVLPMLTNQCNKCLGVNGDRDL